MGGTRRVWVEQLGPVAAVAAAVALLLIELGVRAWEIAAYCGYEVAFVLVPGVLLTLALDGWKGGLRLVSIGWAVGYTLSTIVFGGAVAIGSTGWYVAYPVLVSALASGWIIARRRHYPEVDSRPAGSSAGGNAWWLALVAIIAVGLLAAEYMAPQPLPRDLARGAQYNGDSMYLMSLAGEAEHRFPLTDPTVSGTPLDYHVLSLVEMGASASVTRIELSVIVLRLAYIPLLLVLILQIAWLARYRGRGLAVGALAAAFVLLVGELDLTPTLDYPFLDIFYTLLWFAPAAASMIIFVPLVVLLGETLQTPASASKSRWLLTAFLLVGAAGTKGANILPVLMGAALLVLAWRVLTRRHLDASAWMALGIAVVTIAFLIAADVLEYGGHRRGLTFSPLASFHEMAPLVSLRSVFGGGGLGQVYWWAAVPLLGLFGLLSSQTAGLGLALRRPRQAAHAIDGWLLALGACSILPLFLFNQAGLSHLHSMAYGRIVVGVLAADGLASQPTRRALRCLRSYAVVGGATLVALGCLGVVPLIRTLTPGRTFALDYAAVTAVLTGAGVLGWKAGGRSVAAVAVAVALIGVATLNTPLDAVPRVVDAVLNGRSVAAQGSVELTPALYRGLRWLRSHSAPADVIAVNNQTFGPSGPPVDFYYSAISERSVFLEGWANTERALDLGYRRVVSGKVRPFPGRERLNHAVFVEASPRALRVMSNVFGVKFLVVDDQTGAANPRLGTIARLVYDEPGVQIYVTPARDRRT